ncbi:MAG: nucleoside monophosphate kinase [Patescibacteria group bacterium]
MDIFLITGKPACGKDTQADFIAKKFKAKKIITSKLVGNFLSNTALNKIKIGNSVIDLEKQRKIPEQGKLWNPKLVSFVLSKELLKAIKLKKSIVISGSPRTLAEAKDYFDILNKNLNKEDYHFINLKISDKTSIKRALLRKRNIDDSAKVVKERLNVFKKQILPTIFFLKKQGVLMEINGEKTRKEIFAEICKKVEKKFKC